MSDPSGKPSTETRLPDAQHQRAGGLWTALGVVLCVLVVAVAGFASFTGQSRKMIRPAHLSVDGIVVLTGGPERIPAAVRLLEQKTARRLLISGVYPATTARQLRRITKAEAGLFKCCVGPGQTRPPTPAEMLPRRPAGPPGTKFSKLAVVTSDYHILRAIVEFSRAMPDIELVAYPVASGDVTGAPRSFSTCRLWLSEYVKYLLALVRLQVGN